MDIQAYGEKQGASGLGSLYSKAHVLYCVCCKCQVIIAETTGRDCRFLDCVLANTGSGGQMHYG